MHVFSKQALNTIELFKRRGIAKYSERHQQGYFSVEFPPRDGTPFKAQVNIPHLDFLQPPDKFEKDHGLNGIAEQYKLPEGLTAHNLQIFAMLTLHRPDITDAERADIIENTCALLASINPQIKNTQEPLKTIKDKYHLILGVASAFNMDDINHFIFYKDAEKTPPIFKMQASDEFKSLSNAFNSVAQKNELCLGWLASPQTLKRIENKLLGRDMPSRIRQTIKKSNPPANGF